MREICESRNAAIEKLGMKDAKSLAARVAELWAASTASDVPIGSTVNRDGVAHLRVPISSELSLWMISTSKPHLGKSKPTIDWSNVDRVKIVGIE